MGLCWKRAARQEDKQQECERPLTYDDTKCDEGTQHQRDMRQGLYLVYVEFFTASQTSHRTNGSVGISIQDHSVHMGETEDQPRLLYALAV